MPALRDLLFIPEPDCSCISVPPASPSHPIFFPVQFSGSISYNGVPMHEFLPVRTAAYVPQTSQHIGEMTVRDTFHFAARMQGPGYREGEGGRGLWQELEKLNLGRTIRVLNKRRDTRGRTTRLA